MPSLLHQQKKKPYLIQIHNQLLEHVTSAKYLECTINNSLVWDQHADKIIAKANNTIGFRRQNLDIRSTRTKETANNTMVRHCVEYASCLWDLNEAGDISKLEKIQQRAARFVTYRYHNHSSVTNIIKQLEWQFLETRRKETRLTFLNKIISNEVAINPTIYRNQNKTEQNNWPLLLYSTICHYPDQTAVLLPPHHSWLEPLTSRSRVS